MILRKTAEFDELIRRIILDNAVTAPDASDSFFCPRIWEGMFILKSVDSKDPKDDIFIHLDDMGCANSFLDNPDITMQGIIDYFNADQQGYIFTNAKMDYTNRKVVEWSRIVNDRVGQCLEMAIMSQLLFQKNNEVSFLCGGRSNYEMRGTHAWNLRKKDEKYFIWDCALRFYAPLDKLEIKKFKLYMHPDYKKSIGNKYKVVYKIGGD